MPGMRRPMYAWIAIYGALIAVTSLIPTIPYPTGGGILPLSVSAAALAPLVLGFRGGLAAALLGGIVGSFINPAAYPFGIVDAFFMAMFPALCTGLIFSRNRKLRIFTAIFIFASGIFAIIIPYLYPGPSRGFQQAPQPLYTIVVLGFFIPWFVIYVSPIGSRLVFSWLKKAQPFTRFLGFFVGILSGLMLWSLWQISLWAMSAGFPPAVTLTLWFYAGTSRLVLAAISALLATTLFPALERSSLPAPDGAIWTE